MKLPARGIDEDVLQWAKIGCETKGREWCLMGSFHIKETY